jgi:hypothetical protein
MEEDVKSRLITNTYITIGATKTIYKTQFKKQGRDQVKYEVLHKTTSCLAIFKLSKLIFITLASYNRTNRQDILIPAANLRPLSCFINRTAAAAATSRPVHAMAYFDAFYMHLAPYRRYFIGAATVPHLRR